MAKTKPIGVRFHEPTFEKLKLMGYATPQKALAFLEKFWIETVPKLVEFNNLPKNKIEILKERAGYSNNLKDIDPTAGDRVALNKVHIQDLTNPEKKTNYHINTKEEMESRVAKIEEDLKISEKYLPRVKRMALEKELDHLKHTLNQ